MLVLVLVVMRRRREVGLDEVAGQVVWRVVFQRLKSIRLG